MNLLFFNKLITKNNKNKIRKNTLIINHHSRHNDVLSVTTRPRPLCSTLAATLTHLGLFYLLEKEEQLSKYNKSTISPIF